MNNFSSVSAGKKNIPKTDLVLTLKKQFKRKRSRHRQTNSCSLLDRYRTDSCSLRQMHQTTKLSKYKKIVQGKERRQVIVLLCSLCFYHCIVLFWLCGFYFYSSVCLLFSCSCVRKGNILVVILFVLLLGSGQGREGQVRRLRAVTCLLIQSNNNNLVRTGQRRV